MTNPTFAELGLAEPLLRALSDADYTHPTPIQAKSIPALLGGRDLLGLAETGTGKTAAFVLPLLHRLAAEGGRPQPGAPSALILAPTRELAIQIGESIAAYGRHVRISHTVIFGGVGQRPQVSAIARGVDILVATPGRLLDLVDQRHLRLDRVRTFILDEADRMLDMGFVRDVRRILKLVPTERHSLLFSATMPEDIARLAAEFLKDPIRVEIARAGKTVDRIDQRVIFIPAAAKRDVLARLLQDEEMRRVIVFTRTKRGADRVCKAVEHIGVGVHAIHGNKSQGQRQAALESFRKGFTRVLVATDIAARGIDIDEITHVINYELPNVPESYVHRIGRTARAGAEGVAIALCAPDEREYLRDIEKLTGRRLSVVAAPGGVRLASDVNVSAPAEEAGSELHAPEPRHARAAPDRGDRRERSEGRPRFGKPQYGRQGERSERQGPRGERSERGERQAHGDRPSRAGGDRPHASRGERPQHARDDRPQRPHGDRPQRSDERGGGFQERSGHRGRNSEQRAHDGEPRGRQGGRPGDRHGASHGGRPNGNGQRSAHGEGRTAGANGGGREEGAQPWRNWTKGPGVSRQDGTRQDGQRPARPAKSRPHNHRGQGGRGPGSGQGHGQGQHRSRDAR